jgi:ABC-type antimicrobial peptide transport system permease subunit
MSAWADGLGTRRHDEHDETTNQGSVLSGSLSPAALGVAGAGLIVGLTAGAATAPLFGGLMVNVSPRDPLTILVTTLVVFSAAVMASAPPAVRAARVDPLRIAKAE